MPSQKSFYNYLLYISLPYLTKKDKYNFTYRVLQTRIQLNKNTCIKQRRRIYPHRYILFYTRIIWKEISTHTNTRSRYLTCLMSVSLPVVSICAMFSQIMFIKQSLLHSMRNMLCQNITMPCHKSNFFHNNSIMNRI